MFLLGSLSKIERSRLIKKMCFDIGYNFKNGKLVRVTKESDRDDREQECKGLLSKEIERWKKQQERSNSAHVEAPSASTTTPSKCKHLSSS